MIALDTNALARLLIVDDPRQSAAVAKLVERERVLILRTVLLECEWVLRSRFGLERARIAAFFANLADTANVVMEDDPQVRAALESYHSGMDFADAMHLAAAQEHTLHTFDAKLARGATRQGLAIKLIKA